MTAKLIRSGPTRTPEGRFRISLEPAVTHRDTREQCLDAVPELEAALAPGRTDQRGPAVHGPDGVVQRRGVG